MEAQQVKGNAPESYCDSPNYMSLVKTPDGDKLSRLQRFYNCLAINEPYETI